MKKHFILPREFAEKWLTALRSGDYTQGIESLMNIPAKYDSFNSEIIDNVDFKECEFCCLGVAAHIAGYSNSEISTETLLEPNHFTEDKLPLELLEISDFTEDTTWNSFTLILTLLNDGLNESTYIDKLSTKDYVYRHANPAEYNFSKGDIKYNFSQIADFIEDNCEFYDANYQKQ